MITLVLAYYENPNMLEVQRADWGVLSEEMQERVHVVVVDDGSPNHPAAECVEMMSDWERSFWQIYRMGVDVPWNQDACRNVGVRHAPTNWVLMTDMDHRVPEKTWRVLLDTDWNPEFAYYFQRVSAPDMTPYKSHPNSWFMHRDLFEKMGGYDERFAGRYGTDGDFKVRLHRKAAQVLQVQAPLIRVPREVVPDASTIEDKRLVRKRPGDSEQIKAMINRREASKDKSTMRYRFPYERVA